MEIRGSLAPVTILWPVLASSSARATAVNSLNDAPLF